MSNRDKSLYVCIQGTLSFDECPTGHVNVYIPRVRGHVYLAGTGGQETCIADGSHLKLENVSPGAVKPIIDLERNITLKPFEAGFEPPDPYATLEFGTPREAYPLVQCKVPEGAIFGNNLKDLTQVSTLSFYQIFAYDYVEDNPPLLTDHDWTCPATGE